jgi:CRP/FNR family transcriptional regulator, cyclic AMP receptor protein
MSIAIVTSETRFLDFPPTVDSRYGLPAVTLGSTDKFAGNSFFSNLSEPSIRAINQIARVHRRPVGTIMFLEGDTAKGVYILYEGCANVLTTNTAGKTLILKIALPGDVLGLNSVLAGTSHEVTVETVQPCRFAFVAREDFLKFVKEYSDACLYFAQHLGRDCQSAYNVIRSMGNPVSKRLARFLVTCCANGQVNDGDGSVRAKLFLTHEAIAQRIGCSRETVSRMFSDFKRKRIAELVGSTLLVHDRTALESLTAN